MPDSQSAAELTDVIRSLAQMPVPERAVRPGNDMSLFCLPTGEYDVIYNVDYEEKVVHLLDIQKRHPNA
jgi:hypothetical protein